MASEDADTTIPQEAIEALKLGNKIRAIKLTREATGLGLKEAKDAVEDLIRKDSAIRLDYESNAPNSSGCMLTTVVVLITVAVIYYVFVYR